MRYMDHASDRRIQSKQYADLPPSFSPWSGLSREKLKSEWSSFELLGWHGHELVDSKNGLSTQSTSTDVHRAKSSSGWGMLTYQDIVR